jgi:hypothetical protein
MAKLSSSVITVHHKKSRYNTYTNKPPLSSSGQSSWLPIWRSRVRFPALPDLLIVFWEVVGLEWGSLSLLSTNEELLGRNSNSSGLESCEYGSGNLLRWPHDTHYLQKLPLTSLTSGGCSVGIVLSWTKVTEFSFFIIHSLNCRIQEGSKSNYIQYNYVQAAPYSNVEKKEESSAFCFLQNICSTKSTIEMGHTCSWNQYFQFLFEKYQIKFNHNCSD